MYVKEGLCDFARESVFPLSLQWAVNSISNWKRLHRKWASQGGPLMER